MTAVELALLYIENLRATRRQRPRQRKAAPKPRRRAPKRPEPAQEPRSFPDITPVYAALPEVFGPSPGVLHSSAVVARERLGGGLVERDDGSFLWRGRVILADGETLDDVLDWEARNDTKASRIRA